MHLGQKPGLSPSEAVHSQPGVALGENCAEYAWIYYPPLYVIMSESKRSQLWVCLTHSYALKTHRNEPNPCDWRRKLLPLWFFVNIQFAAWWFHRLMLLLPTTAWCPLKTKQYKCVCTVTKTFPQWTIWKFTYGSLRICHMFPVFSQPGQPLIFSIQYKELVWLAQSPTTQAWFSRERNKWTLIFSDYLLSG